MTWVIAHRGASWHEPENTLPAFERAIALGADFVEFDVHAARDGALVVCHDPPQGGEPRLEEVLEVLRGRIGIMCELKSPWRYRRHDVVRRTVRLLPEDAIVLSFDRRALEPLRSRRTLQHVGYGVSIRAAARYAWGVGFHDPRVTRRGISKAAALGLATPGLHGQRPGTRCGSSPRSGVDGIVTDRPDLGRATLPRSPRASAAARSPTGS